ncbi:hypothetical protein BU23DRAFT_571550 [Bimuria novae-zelandiae CBS 107.79]|uniref:Uncharacterized protein n=1 Tax=Bimuria novae-zelandiae CBS 107.79 TaxID=1447943 RepID=A0A6A5UWV5_9PLEO|nr:hypothetical protein BU23DRAFT_571550 [Bimuria novae-zelandiae CBS 107.79]
MSWKQTLSANSRPKTHYYPCRRICPRLNYPTASSVFARIPKKPYKIGTVGRITNLYDLLLKDPCPSYLYSDRELKAYESFPAFHCEKKDALSLVPFIEYPFRFLDLPAELRLEVYQYYFHDLNASNLCDAKHYHQYVRGEYNEDRVYYEREPISKSTGNNLLNRPVPDTEAGLSLLRTSHLKYTEGAANDVIWALMQEFVCMHRTIQASIEVMNVSDDKENYWNDPTWCDSDDGFEFKVMREVNGNRLAQKLMGDLSLPDSSNAFGYPMKYLEWERQMAPPRTVQFGNPDVHLEDLRWMFEDGNHWDVTRAKIVTGEYWRGWKDLQYLLGNL